MALEMFAEIYSQSSPRTKPSAGSIPRPSRSRSRTTSLVVKPEHIIEVISQESRIPKDDNLPRHLRPLSAMERDLGAAWSARRTPCARSRTLKAQQGPLKENHYARTGAALPRPTGVGKTELAKAVAEFMFGDEHKMVRIAMSDTAKARSASQSCRMPRGIVARSAAVFLPSTSRKSVQPSASGRAKKLAVPDEYFPPPLTRAG